MILIVDDAPANIDVLIAAIGDIDDIAVALDGEEALSIIEEEKPDLVLLDIIMPGIDGFEVCSRIKKNPETSGIPVIFLSGNDSPEEKLKGAQLGAADYMTKPVDSELLLSKIKQYR